MSSRITEVPRSAGFQGYMNALAEAIMSHPGFCTGVYSLDSTPQHPQTTRAFRRPLPNGGFAAMEIATQGVPQNQPGAILNGYVVNEGVSDSMVALTEAGRARTYQLVEGSSERLDMIKAVRLGHQLGLRVRRG